MLQMTKISKMALLLFELFLFVHEHKLTVSIDFVALTWHTLTSGANMLHLIGSQTINILVSSRKLLAVLCSLVDNWHVLQIVDV